MSSKYLIVKGCAGLGNRLVTILAAIKYCQASSRILIIDWADGQFERQGVNAFDLCFKISNVNYLHSAESISNWDGLLHNSFLFKTNKNKGVYDLYIENEYSLFRKLPTKIFPFSWVKQLKRNWIPLQKKNKRLPFGADLSINLKEDVVYFVDFLPVISFADMPKYIDVLPIIRSKINQFTIENNLHKAIGVHIRNTDKKPTKELKVLFDYLNNHKPLSIFLSTDSIEVESLFLKEFANVIVYKKTIPLLKGEGLHQWALYNNQEKLKYVMYEEAVIEMFLLSNCKELLYQGNSTFSNISKAYHQNINNCFDWQKL